MVFAIDLGLPGPTGMRTRSRCPNGPDLAKSQRYYSTRLDSFARPTSFQFFGTGGTRAPGDAPKNWGGFPSHLSVSGDSGFSRASKSNGNHPAPKSKISCCPQNLRIQNTVKGWQADRSAPSPLLSRLIGMAAGRPGMCNLVGTARPERVANNDPDRPASGQPLLHSGASGQLLLNPVSRKPV